MREEPRRRRRGRPGPEHQCHRCADQAAGAPLLHDESPLRPPEAPPGSSASVSATDEERFTLGNWVVTRANEPVLQFVLAAEEWSRKRLK